MDYLDRPHCWIPQTQHSSTVRLGALLLPSPRPVTDLDFYLSYLSDKVTWLIQQEESQAEAQEMICGFLNTGLFTSLPQPELEEEPEQWAQHLTLDNGPLRDYLQTQTFLRFPLQTQPTPAELLETLEDQTLEEWLSSMSVHVHE